MNRRTGFTIVELLIVIVVIAILAAISIVTYTGISQRANAATAAQEATQAAKKIKLHSVEHEAYPSDLSVAGLATAGLQYSYSNATNPGSYCVTATSGGVSYFASNTQSVAAPGVCSDHKEGGIGVVHPPTLSTWPLVGGAIYSTSTGITIGTSALTSQTFPLIVGAQKAQWVDSMEQQGGVRLVLRFLREDGSTISAVQIRTASSPVSKAIVAIPEDTTHFQLLTTGSSAGSILSHGGYLYLSS